MLKLRKMISVEEIAKELNISEMTARRDLTRMEESGHQIVKVRGGAKLLEDPDEAGTNYLNNQFYQQCLTCRREKKRRLGKMAASLVQENETILIDAGSTTFHFVGYLGGKSCDCNCNRYQYCGKSWKGRKGSQPF
ncbi:hypothetical protein GCM10020331_095780 [Ectobacillus funiculus]